jgi:3-hydroxybutyryl-CoA dehydratase
MEGDIATFEIEDLAQGKEFSFEKKISSSDVDMFARLTGDNSPIHMEDSFAQKRGFKSLLVHGGLLVGCISQLVGVYFP